MMMNDEMIVIIIVIMMSLLMKMKNSLMNASGGCIEGFNNVRSKPEGYKTMKLSLSGCSCLLAECRLH